MFLGVVDKGEKTMQEKRTFNLVFDIDNVLTDHWVHYPKEIKFFQKKGIVLKAIANHYVFPGVIELMQLLFQMPDVKVSFFSSGHQKRNDLFVELLLTQALGKKRYRAIKDELLIFSGTKNDSSTDLINNTKDEAKLQQELYELQWGNQKKSLKKVLPSVNLEDTVLIDDDHSWVPFGQERSYLYVPGLQSHDYMSHNSLIYDEQQERWKIPFKKVTKFDRFDKESVMDTENIALLLERGKCKIGYFNFVRREYEELELSEDSDASLIAAIKEHYSSDKKETDQQKMKRREELDKELYALLEANQGKTTLALIRKINRMCYVAGVLCKALEHARAGSTLAEFLFPLHFKPAEKSGTFTKRFHTDDASHKNEEYYLYGWEKLRQANPHFVPITPQIYNECCGDELSAEEEEALQKIRDNK